VALQRSKSRKHLSVAWFPVWNLFVGDVGGRSRSLVVTILFHTETEFHVNDHLYFADFDKLKQVWNRTCEQKTWDVSKSTMIMALTSARVDARMF